MSLGTGFSTTGVDVELMELDDRGCDVFRTVLLGVVMTGLGAIATGCAAGLDLEAGF